MWPELRDRRFWFIQLLILLIVLADWSVDLLPGGFVELSLVVVVLFFIPAVYAALNFGSPKAIATILWYTALEVLVITVRHGLGAVALTELLLLAAVGGVGLFVSRRMQREATARRRAAAAEERLRHSEAMYRRLFEVSPVPLLVVNEQGLIREANPAAGAFWCRSPATLMATPLAELFGPARAAELLAPTGDGTRRTRVLEMENAKGSRTWIEPSVTRIIPDAEAALFHVLLRDVTEERRRQLGLSVYATSVLQAQEQERKRIAHELHDDITQSLILLCRQINDAGRECPLFPCPTTTVRLCDARLFAEGLVDRLRRLIRALRPPILDDLGLAPSLGELVAELRRRSGMPGGLTIAGEVRRLPEEIELALYRIAQEATTNVQLHAHASHVSVRLQFLEDEVRLEVTDNGIGFNLEDKDLDAGEAVGLLGMRERAELVGGTLTIRTSPGQGTEITVGVPCGVERPRQPRRTAPA